MPKFDAYLASQESDPQLGAWAVEVKDQPLFDASALAMWLHPNEPGYVRERLRALVKGRIRTSRTPPWLASG